MRIAELFKKKDRRTSKKRTGDRGEELAAEYLKENGYIILERNWRYKRGEIDIIAKRNDCVAIIEVKSTSSPNAEEFKLPCEAVDIKKKQNLTECAQAYRRWRNENTYKNVHDTEYYRFDVIEVYLYGGAPSINHIENAFFAEKGNKKQWKI